MFQFKKAVREQTSVLIGVCGGTGAGKSFSAARLATGLSGGKRWAWIDTEAGRALHYSDQFDFDHGDLKPPFSPAAYDEAIHAADAAGYPVIVVDSMSHEWSGESGILDMQEAELNRMAGDDWKKREACRMSAWIRPKMAHKKMVQRLLQVRAHLILCFRAEEKIEMVKGSDGKMQIIPKTSLTGINGWIPICEKNLPFEMTMSFLLTADAPGLPKPIKIQEQFRAMFPLNKPISTKSLVETVAAWASGGAVPAKAAPVTEEKPPALDEDQFDELVQTLDDCKTRAELVKAYNAAIPVLRDRSTKAQFDKFKLLRDDMLLEIEREKVI